MFPKGFETVARDALGKGETIFNLLKGDVRLDKGNYQIVNTGFVNEDMMIDVLADGSLKNWTGNASLQVTFNDATGSGV